MADARFPLEDYFGFDVRPYSALVRFEAGDMILSEGEANDALFFLEHQSPCEFFGGLSGFLSRQCRGLRPCVESGPEPEE